jgi:hypothetical protein
VSEKANTFEIARLLAKVHPRFSTFAFAFGQSTRITPSLQASKLDESAEFPGSFRIFSTISPDEDKKKRQEEEEKLRSAFADFSSVLELYGSSQAA